MNVYIREIPHPVTNDTPQRAAATTKLIDALLGTLSRTTSRPHVVPFLGFGS
jgi:hypothetical protein